MKNKKIDEIVNINLNNQYDRCFQNCCKKST